MHVLDLIEYVMGEPLADVAGSAANVGSPWLDVEDAVSMSFGFAASAARGTASLAPGGEVIFAVPVSL